MYHKLLTGNGISIHVARCQLYTQRLNRIFIWLGQKNQLFLERWFDMGIFAALLCGCFSVIFLFMVPINTLFRSQSKDEQILKPVVSASVAFYFDRISKRVLFELKMCHQIQIFILLISEIVFSLK